MLKIIEQTLSLISKKRAITLGPNEAAVIISTNTVPIRVDLPQLTTGKSTNIIPIVWALAMARVGCDRLGAFNFRECVQDIASTLDSKLATDIDSTFWRNHYDHQK